MALKRIYAFDISGTPKLSRVPPSEAAKLDRDLVLISLSNWQLATLCALKIEEGRTTSQIGFALSMDRPTVIATLKLLERRIAVRRIASEGMREGVFQLTDHGRDLMTSGLEMWQKANKAKPC